MSVAENSRFRRARSLWAVLALALVAVLAWWLWPRNDAGSRDDAPGKTVPVRVARASAEPLVLRLKAVGTVTPLHSVVVRSRVDGELLRLHFQEGQQVNAGDLLAQIDPRPYEVKLAQAQAPSSRTWPSWKTPNGSCSATANCRSRTTCPGRN